METNEAKLKKIFIQLNEKRKSKDFVIDKSGVKMVELIMPDIEPLDPSTGLLNFKSKQSNENYIKKELDWYNSKNRSIIGYVDDVKIWNDIATKDDKKLVNSNYGWCISKNNFNQYENCKNELIKNPFSRRATMIYNRPSMWYDYDFKGMNDFMCTYAHQAFIRNDKLETVYIMRSNDAIFGMFNDFAWAAYIHRKLEKDLSLKPGGKILWKAASFHVYERHFDLLEKIANEV